MAHTSATIIDDFRAMNRDCGATKALNLLNEVDEEILFHIPLRRAFEPLAIIAGQREMDCPEEVLRVWALKFYKDADTFTTIDETDCDTLDIDTPQWRSASSSTTPTDWYEFADMEGGQVGINPPCTSSTIIVAAATNATPIVVTTDRAHGLTSGAKVKILGALVNTNANGEYYADVTGPTTLRLFTDAALTLPVAGNGLYTANSGKMACEGSPMLVLECSKRLELTYTPAVDMPRSPKIKRLYRAGMDAIWAWERKRADWRDRKKEYEDLLAEQSHMKMKRQARKTVEILTFRQRTGWRNRRRNVIHNP